MIFLGMFSLLSAATFCFDLFCQRPFPNPEAPVQRFLRFVHPNLVFCVQGREHARCFVFLFETKLRASNVFVNLIGYSVVDNGNVDFIKGI